MIAVYCFIVLFACTVGAACGLGGGIMIKPLFDIIGLHDASTISLYSAFAVFTMSITSIYKQIKAKAEVDKKVILFIAIGSALGGVVGDTFISNLDNGLLKTIQSFGLVTSLIVIIYFTYKMDNIKTLTLKNPLLVLCVGLFLGLVSVLLGIGGGPLNILLYTYLFSLEMKDAAIYSIYTIFFSQLAKLIQTFVVNQFIPYDLTYVPFLCVFAILGGIAGTQLNIKATDQMIERLYKATLFLILILSSYNLVISFI